MVWNLIGELFEKLRSLSASFRRNEVSTLFFCRPADVIYLWSEMIWKYEFVAIVEVETPPPLWNYMLRESLRRECERQAAEATCFVSIREDFFYVGVHRNGLNCHNHYQSEMTCWSVFGSWENISRMSLFMRRRRRRRFAKISSRIGDCVSMTNRREPSCGHQVCDHYFVSRAALGSATRRALELEEFRRDFDL